MTLESDDALIRRTLKRALGELVGRYREILGDAGVDAPATLASGERRREGRQHDQQDDEV